MTSTFFGKFSWKNKKIVVHSSLFPRLIIQLLYFIKLSSNGGMAMLENGFVYAGVVFGILTVFIGGVLFVIVKMTDQEGKRPGEH